MILEVAERPLIFVVETFPVLDCVKELTIEASVELIPFTTILNRFAEEEATAVLILVVVDMMPFTFEVRMFADEVRVLVVLEATRFEREVVATTPLTVLVSVEPLVDSV